VKTVHLFAVIAASSGLLAQTALAETVVERVTGCSSRELAAEVHQRLSEKRSAETVEATGRKGRGCRILNFGEIVAVLSGGDPVRIYSFTAGDRVWTTPRAIARCDNRPEWRPQRLRVLAWLRPSACDARAHHTRPDQPASSSQELVIPADPSRPNEAKEGIPSEDVRGSATKPSAKEYRYVAEPLFPKTVAGAKTRVPAGQYGTPPRAQTKHRRASGPYTGR
jgi:hypothetical protein